MCRGCPCYGLTREGIRQVELGIVEKLRKIIKR